MKVHLRRYGVVWFLLAYWSLSFVVEFFLNGHPLSSEAWQGMRLLALLLPAVWLFYQWQWHGQLLLQWQGIAFSFSLVVLPAVAFFFSS